MEWLADELGGTGRTEEPRIAILSTSLSPFHAARCIIASDATPSQWSASQSSARLHRLPRDRPMAPSDTGWKGTTAKSLVHTLVESRRRH